MMGRLKATLILILTGLLSLALGLFWLTDETAFTIVRWLTKPFFSGIYGLLFLLACKVSFRRVRDCASSLDLKRDLFLCGLLSILSVAHLFVSGDTSYKVLNDEYVIAAQAKTLYQQNSFDYPESTLDNYGYVTGVRRLIDKRPAAFANAVALLHTVSGYRPGNIFFFNLLVGGAFTFLVMFLFLRVYPQEERSYTSRIIWLSVPLIWILSTPLFGNVLNSAGLDLFNTFLILLSAYTGYRYLRSQEDSDGILWLLTSLLLVYARYESILFVFSIGLLMLWRTKGQTRLPLFYPLLAFIICCIPFVLQFRIFEAFPERSLNNVPAAGVFSLRYYLPNLSLASDFLFIPRVSGLGSAFVGWTGLFAGMILLVRFLKQGGGLRIQEIKPLDAVLVAYGLIIGVNFLILMGYYWGQLVQYEVARLALPMHLLLGALVLRVLVPLARRLPQIIWIFTVSGLIYILMVSSPMVNDHPHVYANRHASTDQWAKSVILKHSEKPYVITPRPVFWYLYDIGSSSPDIVAHSLSSFAYYYRTGAVSPFLLAEYRIDPFTETAVLVGGSELLEAVHLEKIAEASFHANRVIRIYRIVGFKVDFSSLAPNSLDHQTFLKYPVETWFMKRF